MYNFFPCICKITIAFVFISQVIEYFQKTPHACHLTRIEKKNLSFQAVIYYMAYRYLMCSKVFVRRQKYQVGKFFKYLTERLVYLQLLRMYSVTKSIFWLVSKAINTPSVCPHDSIAYTEVAFPVPKTLKQWLPALLYTNCISSHEATIRNKFH